MKWRGLMDSKGGGGGKRTVCVVKNEVHLRKRYQLSVPPKSSVSTWRKSPVESKYTMQYLFDRFLEVVAMSWNNLITIVLKYVIIYSEPLLLLDHPTFKFLHKVTQGWIRTGDLMTRYTQRSLQTQFVVRLLSVHRDLLIMEPRSNIIN